MTPEGVFAIDLGREVLETIPECKYRVENSSPDINSVEYRDISWHYHPQYNLLYHWSQKVVVIEARRFSCMELEGTMINRSKQLDSDHFSDC